MKKTITILALFIIGFTANIYSQSAGDYRSAADGDWSVAATWETYNGSAWEAAASAPTGSENITVLNAVPIDVAVSITGTVKVEGSGILYPGAGSISFDNGSTYEHARNAGEIVAATWNTGSTCLVTGVTSSSPGGSNQDFYNFTWNCTSQSSNLDVSWSGNTIGGDLTVLSTGGTNQFRLTSSSDYTDTIKIAGDVNLSDGVLTVTGSSTAMEYQLVVNGDINITGGSFALSRGSGGNVSWNIHGDLSIENAELRSSNSASKFFFAASDTQNVYYEGVTYNGTVNYIVDTNSVLVFGNGPDSLDITVSGTFTAYGLVDADAVFNFANGSVYRHARNSGSLPIGIWNEGSTVMIEGVTGTLPANRNQSFYNIIYNCPTQTSNLNFGFNNVTIGGDITVLSTGASSRIYLCGPQADSTVSVTINGNIISNNSQFASQGTGNGNTHVFVYQYGNIKADSGNFSIGRGSQGNGSGTVSWFFYGDSISLSNLTTQNSNPLPGAAKFFISDSTVLSLTNVAFGGGGFPVEVDTGAVLYMGESIVRGSGVFNVNTDATLYTANAGGLDSTVQATAGINLSREASYGFNGSTAQTTGLLLPDTLKNLVINNPAGVTLNISVNVDNLVEVVSGDLLLNGNMIILDEDASLSETPGNTVTGTTGKITTIRNINAPASLNVAGLGIVITSASDLGSTLVERYHAAGTGGGNSGILREFNISPANNSGLNATLRFYYDESELNGIPETNLIPFKSEDGSNDSWDPEVGTLNTDENYVEITGISDLSFWTLADADNPVPVELTSFTASVDAQNVILKWTTATELQNKGWEIERKKSDATEWEKAGFVSGAGDNLEAAAYSFKDKKLPFGKYQYRLRQIDFDGSVVISSSVEADIAAPKEFALHQNYPNPFNPETVIRFELPEASFVNITIYNSIGEKVAVLVNERMEQGIYNQTFNGANLTSGMYIYRLTTDKSVQTKKMLFMK